jgi:uncharacterized membrane protein (DUF4010 family)
MNPLAPTVTWVPFESLARLTLSLLLGLFVGLEREWRGKDAGLRTFGLTALLGAMGAMIGLPYAIVSLAGTGLLVIFLNVQSLRQNQGTELTTSAALFVAALSGVLCGLGHTITPVAIMVITAALLSWKERLAEFGHRLTAEEIRAAVLLAILAFAIYPVLPSHPVDRWGLIVPRTAWITVILIAGMGFVNYVLWKMFGARGIEFAGFLGGLVNSTVTATELASRVSDLGRAVESVAYRGLMLSLAAMAVRNALIIGVFKWHALLLAGPSLCAMFVVSAGLAVVAGRREGTLAKEYNITLSSPFSLRSALKFGVIFLAMQVAGAIAQSLLGRLGFYGVSILGGLVSSASAVASAAQLAAAGRVQEVTAGVGCVLASIASAGVNLVLVARLSRSASLVRRVSLATVLTILVGVAGVIVSVHATPP